MKDKDKTKKQLIAELEEIQQRIAELETWDNLEKPDGQCAIGQAVIATDLQGTIIYCNSTAESMYGWSAVEMYGQNITDIIPAQNTKKQAIEIMSHLRTGETWSGEFWVKRKDGTPFPVEVTDTPIHDKEGKLIGIIGVSTDITEHKKVDKELRFR
ncbi:PAS domain-containing protein [Chloroflexota bacterium]